MASKRQRRPLFLAPGGWTRKRWRDNFMFRQEVNAARPSSPPPPHVSPLRSALLSGSGQSRTKERRLSRRESKGLRSPGGGGGGGGVGPERPGPRPRPLTNSPFPYVCCRSCSLTEAEHLRRFPADFFSPSGSFSAVCGGQSGDGEAPPSSFIAVASTPPSTRLSPPSVKVSIPPSSSSSFMLFLL